MKKTKNFLNNQRYIVSERVKKKLFLKTRVFDIKLLGISLYLWLIIILTIGILHGYFFESKIGLYCFFIFYISPLIAYLIKVIYLINERFLFIVPFFKRNIFYVTPNIIKKLDIVSLYEFENNIYYEITKN